jgi:hypothetical protein
MNYEEFQIWYHSFNLFVPECIKRMDATTEEVITAAKQIADVVVEEYKKIPNKPKQLDASKIISDTVKSIANKK